MKKVIHKDKNIQCLGIEHLQQIMCHIFVSNQMTKDKNRIMS